MSQPRDDRRALWICALLVFAVTALAFSPALSAEFVEWDDGENFVENHAFRGLSGEHLRWMFTTMHMGPYQPLSWLSLALDHTLWGLDPHAFHRTNVALHALAAVLLFFFALRLLQLARETTSRDTLFAAAAAALFFAVHPLRCESVAWVTERRDVLSGVFYVGSLCAYVKAAAGERRARWLAIALVLYVLGLLSKASGITLPLVLLCLDAWPLGRLTRSREERARAIREKIAFVVPAVAVAWVAVVGQAQEQGALRSLAQHGLVERAAQAAYAACFYPWKTLVPTGLIPIYEMPRPFVATELRFVVSAAIAIALTVAAIALRKRAPAFSVAWIAYGVLLAPVSGLAQAGPQLVADRYSYLSCMPLALLAAGLLSSWSERGSEQRLYAAQLAAGAVLVFAILTFQQTRIWRTSETLWTHTLRHAPDSQSALQNFGASRLHAAGTATDPAERRQLRSQAAALFDRGLQVSTSTVFCLNRALVCVIEAEEDPVRAPDLLERARGLVEQGIALAKERGHAEPELSMHLASILMKLGRNDEALPLLEEFARVEPDDVLGRRRLGVALVAAGRPRDAIPHLEHALKLEPNDATLWLRIGYAHEALNELDAAITAFERTIALSTASASATSDLDAQRAREAIDRLLSRSKR